MGDLLPLIVFGRIVTEAQYYEECRKNGKPAEFPSKPGAFALQSPYEFHVILVDDRCPAEFVNDAKGVANLSPTIKFVQHGDPRELHHEPALGLQLLLQAQATSYSGITRAYFSHGNH